MALEFRLVGGVAQQPDACFANALDEDASGNGRHLTTIGSPQTGSSPSLKYGRGYRLPGAGVYFTQSHPAFRLTGDMAAFAAVTLVPSSTGEGADPGTGGEQFGFLEDASANSLDLSDTGDVTERATIEAKYGPGADFPGDGGDYLRAAVGPWNLTGDMSIFMAFQQDALANAENVLATNYVADATGQRGTFEVGVLSNGHVYYRHNVGEGGAGTPMASCSALSNDVTGNARHMSPQNGPGIRAGFQDKWGNGYEFNGTNERLIATDAAVCSQRTVSMFVVFELDTLSGQRAIISSGRLNLGENVYDFLLYWNGTALHFVHENAANQADVFDLGSLSTGTQYAVWIRRDQTGKTISISLDGTEAFSDASYSFDPDTGSVQNRVAVANGGLIHMDGAVYEYRYWGNQLVDKATLDAIADPSSPDYQNLLEGNESAAWIMCGDTPADQAFTSEGSTVLANGFHKLTLRRDIAGRAVEVYVDDVLEIDDTWTEEDDPIGQTSAQLTLGERTDGSTNAWNGSIHEFRIWDDLIAQATLDEMADEADNAFKNQAEGTELALYYLEDQGALGAPTGPPKAGYILSAYAADGDGMGNPRELYGLLINDSQEIEYVHRYGNGAMDEVRVSGSTILSAGGYRITLRRDLAAKTIVVKVNGVTEINHTWSGGEDPLTGSTVLAWGARADGDEFYEGGIFEGRIWNTALAQATLDEIANPADSTHREEMDGGEIGAWFFECTRSLAFTGDPLEIESGFVIKTFGRFGRHAEIVVDDDDGTVSDAFPDYTPCEIQFNEDDAGWMRLFGGFISRNERTRNQASLTVLSHDAWLRRREVFLRVTATPISEVLQQVILGFTPLKYNEDLVDVQSNVLVTRTWKGERVEEVLSELASLSADEEWGANDDQEFFWREAGGVVAPVNFLEADYLETSFEDDNQRRINRALIYYGRDEFLDPAMDASVNRLDLSEQVPLGGDPTSLIEAPSGAEKYGQGLQFPATAGTHLRNRSGRHAISGDLSMTIAFTADDIGGGFDQHMLHARQGTTDTFYEVRLMDDGSVQIMWTDTTDTERTFTSATALVTDGFHTLTIRRDPSFGSLIVNLDGAEIINTTFSGSQAPKPLVSGQTVTFQLGGERAILGAVDPWAGDIFEVRIWDQLVAQSVLDQIADKDDPAFQSKLQGTELACYFLERGNFSGAVAVNDTTEINRVKSSMGLPGDPVVEAVRTYPTIQTQQEAENKAREVLGQAAEIRTGVIQTFDNYDLEAGMITTVENPDEQIDGDFRIAQLKWGIPEGDLEITVAENKAGVIDTLISLGTEVVRVDSREANRDAVVVEKNL